MERLIGIVPAKLGPDLAASFADFSHATGVDQLSEPVRAAIKLAFACGAQCSKAHIEANIARAMAAPTLALLSSFKDAMEMIERDSAKLRLEAHDEGEGYAERMRMGGPR
jgi:hypothetical protein